MAQIPRRPAWRDSDPRWRRRMLAGVWVLAWLPVLDVMQSFGWTAGIPVPRIFGYAVRTLDETLFCQMQVAQALLFFIGLVLLFSKERGPHPRRLEWTRRWGILCACVTLLIRAAEVLFVAALVLVGISATFLTIPLKYQPAVTRFFVAVSTAYLRHGPSPKPVAGAVLVASSSVAIILACVPLFNALRSSAPKRIAAILVAPLALFAVVHLGQAGLAYLHPSRVIPASVARYQLYFLPSTFVTGIAAVHAHQTLTGSELIAVMVELAKWCTILAIAIWLTLARFAGPGKGVTRERRRPRRPRTEKQADGDVGVPKQS